MQDTRAKREASASASVGASAQTEGKAEGKAENKAENKAEAKAPARARVFYQTRDVVELLGISRRQLQYWSQTQLVEPSATTPGGHRRYSFEDLVALKAAKRLIDAGVSVQRIRSSIRSLRRLLPSVERPLSELVLVATGDVVLVFRDGTAFEAVTGQEWVFEVAAFQREVDAWVRTSGGRAPARAAVSSTPPQRSGRAGNV